MATYLNDAAEFIENELKYDHFEFGLRLPLGKSTIFHVDRHLILQRIADELYLATWTDNCLNLRTRCCHSANDLVYQLSNHGIWYEAEMFENLMTADMLEFASEELAFRTDREKKIRAQREREAADHNRRENDELHTEALQ